MVDFAIDIVIAVDEADVFDFGTDFDNRGRSLDFEVFNDGDGIAVVQYIAVSIFNDKGIGALFSGFAFGPFVGAFGADKDAVVFISEFRAACGAWGEIIHFVTLI